MDVSTLYSKTLSQLDETELKMTSPEGDALIQNAAPEEHQKAVKTLLDVHEARLALGNATLQDIADKLRANEAELVTGTTAIKKALDELSDLAKILNAVNSLLKIIIQIVPLFL